MVRRVRRPVDGRVDGRVVDVTDTGDMYGLWARALSDERMATDLIRLAGNVRFYSPAQRRALLLEAARRLQKAG